MSKRLDQAEAQRQARWDAENRERDITDPLEAPTQPFSELTAEMPKENLIRKATNSYHTHNAGYMEHCLELDAILQCFFCCFDYGHWATSRQFNANV